MSIEFVCCQQMLVSFYLAVTASVVNIALLSLKQAIAVNQGLSKKYNNVSVITTRQRDPWTCFES